MIVLFIILVCLFLITFSLGDIFLKFANICKCNINLQAYLVTDKIFLGLISLTFILLLLNFWLPINGYTFIVFLFLCLVYFISYLLKNRFRINNKSKAEIICGVIALITTVYISLFMNDSIDSRYYHMQFIESMYQHPIIKGLANLEDRYGFNSSIFVLYPLFSFKLFFNLHIFELNHFLFGFTLWYLLTQIAREFSLTNIVYLLLFGVAYCLSDKALDSTSNDMTIVVIAFYITLRYLSNNKDIFLLYAITPCLMVTTKLSSIFFGLFTLIIIFILFKDRKKHSAYFIIITCSMFCLVWLARNIYISGYLIYPLYQIDLFNVEWKVPKVVLMIQKEYIHDFAWSIMNATIKSILSPVENIRSAIFDVVVLIIIATPFLMYRIRRKNKNNFTCLLILFIGLLFSIWQAPDFRFYAVYVYPILLIITSSFLSNVKVNKNLKYLILSFSAYLIIYSYYSLNNYNFAYIAESNRSILRLIFKPQADRDTIRFRDKSELKKVSINGFEIEINIDNQNLCYFTYELFPSSSLTGYPLMNPSNGFKIQALQTIELIGDSINEGFKTTDEWKQRFNEEESSILEKYREGIVKRVGN